VITDSELLRQYVKDGSEAAFTELVQRYGALVYSAALRSVGGQGPLAAEVTQDVFILLVRKAPSLIKHETLVGWLHTTTRYVALRALHKLRQRDVREQEAVAMQTLSSPEVQWEQLRPLLDEAVGQLNDHDRDAVLLRYFQGWSHREVGVALGLNEDAARMRIDRAVEKLRHYFARSGVVTSAALLAEALAANSVQAAPTGLLGSVASTSFAHGQKLGLGHSLLKALYMTTNTKIILTAAVLGAAFAVGWSGPSLMPGKPVVSKATVVSTLVVKKYPKPPADVVARAEAGLLKAMHTPGSPLDKLRAEYDFLGKLDAGTIMAMLDDILTKPASDDTRNMLHMLSTRMVELDPGAVIDWLPGVHDRQLRVGLTQTIFAAYASIDPKGALNTLAWLPSTNYLLPAAGGQVADGVYRPPSAIGAQMQAQEGLEMAEAAVLNTAARQDPAATFAALQALPDDAPNKGSLERFTFSIFAQWALQDPTTAAQEALALPEGQNRSHSLDYVAQSWSIVDPAAAVAWLNTLPADSKNKEIQSVITNLGITDGPALMPFLNSLPDGPNNPLFIQQLNADASDPKPYVLDGVTTAWAQSDPAGLLAFADQNLAGKAYDTAYTAAINQLTNTDPASAAAYLAQHPDPTVAAQTYPVLAKTWAQQDPTAALAWAQSLSTDNFTLRNSTLNGVAQGMVATDPQAAATYVQQNMANDPDFIAMTTHITNAWGSAGGDPVAALSWAESLPPVTRNRAVVAAVTQLAKADPALAAQTAQAELDNLTKLTATQQSNLQNIVNGIAKPKNPPSTSTGK